MIENKNWCDKCDNPEFMCHYKGGCKYDDACIKAEQILDDVLKEMPCCHHYETGSRVICNPPVLDTDYDFVFDCSSKGQMHDAEKFLKGHGFFINDLCEDEYDDIRENFTAYRFGDLNFILCNSRLFYRKFILATELAKKLNLLKKQDRIDLFQAILYGKLYGDEY